MDEETRRVLALVRQYLEPYQPTDYRLNISDVGVRHEDDWWEIVVQPSREDVRSYDYYGRLAEAEVDIEDKEHLNILLVPVLHG